MFDIECEARQSADTKASPPFLSQLSLAVAQNSAAQRTIANLCAAFEEAERTTRGFSNAFSIEVFHAMNAPDEESGGEDIQAAGA